MKNRLLGLFRKHAELPQVLDYNKLPILDAQALIHHTEQQNRIRNIKRIVQIDEQRFQILYLDVIERFAELVQLMPASQAHHHAVPGGLFIHTIEVIEWAVLLRQQYKLPLFEAQEIQEQQKHIWTYAIFVAAILHDVGKRITMCQFVLDNGNIQQPFGAPITQSGQQSYKIEFKSPKFHPLHDRLGLMFANLIPDVGINFLLNQLNIVEEIMAYIHQEDFTDGMVGKILKEADQHSTGQSLAHIPTRKFKGALLENIGERLMSHFRVMLASNDFVINKNNASIYTTEEGYTYAICKVLADNLRTNMQANEEHDIPSDNNRIFDIFQEYGFAETNPATSKAIHHIRRVYQGKTQVFTVLKFESRKLFRALPEAYAGQIEEFDSTAPNQSESNPIPATETTRQTDTVNTYKQSTDTKSNQSNPGTKANDIAPETENNQAIPTDSNATSEQASNQSHSAKVNKQNEDTARLDLAEKFLDWYRNKILNKEIQLNETGGVIQKVKYKQQSVIALVTPRAFLDFAVSLGLPNHKSSAEKIQSAIHTKKLNIKAPRGQIHKYKILKSQNNPMNKHNALNFYLFTIDSFCGQNDTSGVKVIVEKLQDNSNLGG